MQQSASLPLPVGLKVMIGMPIGRDLPPQTALSLFATAQRCAALGIETTMVMHMAVTELARDLVLADFVESDFDRLFWIDSDMVWEPDEFIKLVALSTRKNVVCATYPAKAEGKLTYYLNMAEGGEIGEFGLIPIKGAGLGFTVMDRLSAQAVSNMGTEITDQISGRTYRSVFRRDIINGHARSEDMAFFADIIECGFGVWLDPAVTLGHMGMRQWRGKAADALHIVDDEATAAA